MKHPGHEQVPIWNASATGGELACCVMVSAPKSWLLQLINFYCYIYFNPQPLFCSTLPRARFLLYTQI